MALPRVSAAHSLTSSVGTPLFTIVMQARPEPSEASRPKEAPTELMLPAPVVVPSRKMGSLPSSPPLSTRSLGRYFSMVLMSSIFRVEVTTTASPAITIFAMIHFSFLSNMYPY